MKRLRGGNETARLRQDARARQVEMPGWGEALFQACERTQSPQGWPVYRTMNRPGPTHGEAGNRFNPDFALASFPEFIWRSKSGALRWFLGV